MRLTLFCPTCGADSSTYRVPFADNGIYHFGCMKGHRNTIGLTAFRFEVLSEIAVQALADGYLREAVLTFNSSLERFYEFCVRLIWEARSVKADVRDATWKAVASSSERQLGLFLGAHCMATGSSPPLLGRRLVELRNDVVHKGIIPEEGETAAFGQAVIDLMHPLLHQLVIDNKAAAETLHKAHCEEAFAVAGGGEMAWAGYAFPVSRARADTHPLKLLDEVARRRRRDSQSVAI